MSILASRKRCGNNAKILNDMSVEINFKNISCSELSENEIKQCSILFSNNYGVWGEYPNNPNLLGKQISMSSEKFKNMFVKPDRYIIMAFHDNKLVGHAVYLSRTLPGRKKRIITWILQIVVDVKYRGKHIGRKMMYSIWGMSDYAWGLYTAHPLTIATLEDATLRKVDPKYLTNKHLKYIKSVAGDLFEDMEWINNYHDGKVNTRFFISHEQIAKQKSKSYPQGGFPFHPLEPGEEWLAFAFRKQPLVDNAFSLIRERIEFDMERLKKAYSGMKMKEQTWTQYADEEIDWLLRSHYIMNGSSVLDLGCGIGRYARALKNYNIIYRGIDFINSIITEAVQNNYDNPNALFMVKDARSYRGNRLYDTVLCLYDVIGSFPVDKDNNKIIQSAYKNLKRNGYFVVSVMNLDATIKRCQQSAKKHVVRGIKNHIQDFLDLEPSSAMQNTGEVFNPKTLIVDQDTGVVYRKEQFTPKQGLRSELFIQDKRYTDKSITNSLLKQGFSIVELKYVNAGRWDRSQNERVRTSAKEILVIAQKPNLIVSLWNRMKGVFGSCFFGS